MGNAFYRKNEADLSPALAGGIPMLSSILGMLGKPSGNLLPKLTRFLEQMDPELIESLFNQFSVNKMGRPICCGMDPVTAIFILFLVVLLIMGFSI